MKLRIIAMGHPVNVQVRRTAPLQRAIDVVLPEKELSRSAIWELRSYGNLIDPRKSAAYYDMYDGEELTLFPPAGTAA